MVGAEWEEWSQWWAERVARAELVVGVERVTQGCASSLIPLKADRRRQPPKAAPAASGERGGGRGQVVAGGMCYRGGRGGCTKWAERI